jgi:NAD(P)H-dependent FMN reductase
MESPLPDRLIGIVFSGGSTMLKIAVVLGSTRPKRFGEKPARWILHELAQRARVDATLLDLRDFPMPFFDLSVPPSGRTDDYGSSTVKAWRRKIDEADAYVVVAAEYNHGYTAVLKNAIDFLHKEWNEKPIGFVGYGGLGGSRAIEQLRLVAIELQMAPVRNAVHLPVGLYLSMANEEGSIDPKRFQPVQDAADKMIDQLLWWGEALKAARGKTAQAKEAA